MMQRFPTRREAVGHQATSSHGILRGRAFGIEGKNGRLSLACSLMTERIPIVSTDSIFDQYGITRLW